MKYAARLSFFLLLAGLNNVFSIQANAQENPAPPGLRKVDAALSVSSPDDRRTRQTLSLEARLLYTTLLGRPHGLSEADLQFAKLPPQLSYAGFSLAAAARQVMHIRDEGSSNNLGNSLSRLEEFLSSASAPYAIKDLPKDLPAGMQADDLAMLHVYALVMSGEAEATTSLLEKYLGSKNDFTRTFAMMALRSIGTARARELIKSRVKDITDMSMARDALGMAIPNLIEPKTYEAEVLPAMRYREHLLKQAQANTTQAILPTMLLGFVGNDAKPEQLAAEKEFLMHAYKTADNALWRKYMYAYASLAFRFEVPYQHWVSMFQSDRDPQRRSFILRAMARQHPERFFKEGLSLFAQEKNDVVQLEFFSLFGSLSKGDILTGPFDAIWMPNLRYRLKYPASKEAIKPRSLKPLFALWARGQIAEDPHWPVWMSEIMGADDQAAFLQGYLHMKNPSTYSAYALRELKDPRLLPVIHYLIQQESKADVKKETQYVYDHLLNDVEQAQRQDGECCNATEACLRKKVLDKNKSTIVIKSSKEALQYLQHLPSTPQVKIAFTDDLQRSAKVSIKGGKPQLWEHWLGCWRSAEDKLNNPLKDRLNIAPGTQE